MQFRKKESTAIPKAKSRIASIKSIDPALDLGGGVSVAEYAAAIADAEAKFESYNMTISTISQTYSDMMKAEAHLKDMTERMLNAIAGRYGKRSNEYKMAGGTRRGEERNRKAPEKTKDVVTEPEIQPEA